MEEFLGFFRNLLEQNADTDLRWLDAVSDGLIALAYFSIALTFMNFTRKRKGLAINGVIVLFGVLIVARGITALTSAWGVWYTPLRLEALLDAFTAVLAVISAIACVRLLPVATKIGTPQEMERINAQLLAEIEVRKEAEKKLEALLETQSLAGEAKTRWFVDAVPMGILMVSGDGKIQLVNRRTEQMFGYSRGELVGEGLEVLLPERYRGAHVQHRAGYFAEPGVRAMGVGRDLTALRKDGSEFPVEIGLNYVHFEEGMMALGLVSDITERKGVESELARVNAELIRSNTDLGQFAYVASHDLQEPLRMITGYLQLLERRYNDKLDAEATEFIRYAVEGAVRMKRLIEDLLALSRAGTQAANMRRVAARDLFEIALANLAVAIQESEAEITVDELPEIIADTGLLTQVFQNLIGNAIKFRAKFGRPKIHVSAARSLEGWIFSVRDNGIGIEERHLERIFGIFERLHSAEQYGGSGVGLAITQRILERHGGRVWVESKPGEGSTFFLLIPDRLGIQTRELAGTEKS